jgi:hypothetical protein
MNDKHKIDGWQLSDDCSGLNDKQGALNAMMAIVGPVMDEVMTAWNGGGSGRGPGRGWSGWFTPE